MNILYPTLDDEHFNSKISVKEEFKNVSYKSKITDVEKYANELSKSEFELQPHQKFVKNFMSFNTPYNSLLLYHGLGSGKTCSAIGICETVRNYLVESGKQNKIIIVANPNVQNNFKLQLFNEQLLKEENGGWTINNCVGNKLINEVNPTKIKIKKDKLVKKIKKLIKEYYNFMGYIEFANIIKKYNNDKSIQEIFNNSLLVIDEIHNIKTIKKSDDIDNSFENTVQALDYLVEKTENMLLLLLSATPMYDSYKEIIWLINLLNRNDKRPIMNEQDIFNQEGEFIEGGKETFIRKITGYISFVRGENPYTFPYRVFPFVFDKSKSILSMSYPTLQLNGKPIDTEPIKYLDIYTVKIGNYQYEIYQKMVNNIKNLNFTNLLFPNQALIIVFPKSNYLDKSSSFLSSSIMGGSGEDDNYIDKEYIGKTGLYKFMNCEVSDVSFSCNYREENKEFGRIFDYDLIGNYSCKIKSILDNIIDSKGIILIYSNFIAGGIIPMAISLESMGYNNIDTNLMYEYKSRQKREYMTYAMITGDKRITHNVQKIISTLVNPNNYEGKNIKIILISESGSEGLDFKNIRQMHVMEPWFNMNRIEQIIGRGCRNFSHKNLPFNERNVQIFLYGTIFEKTPNIESSDLYLYRNSEKKIIKISKINRILKEVAVDCIINKEQMNYTEDAFKDQKITQILSDGQIINDFKIGDKPYSSACDYMESCFYKCYDDIDTTNIVDKSTFNEFYLFSNTEIIIEKIKKLFSLRFFYKKDEIINLLSEYPLIQIYASLSYLINYKENIQDRFDQLGHIININEYYIYQPNEISDENISIFDRTVPPFYKNDKIELNIDLFEKEENVNELNLVYDYCEKTYKDSLEGIGHNDNDWYSSVSTSIEVFKDIFGVDDLLCKQFLVHHIFESLLFNDKLLVIQYFFGKPKHSEFGNMLHDYLDKRIVGFNTSFEKKKQYGFYFVDLNEKKEYIGKIILYDGVQWVENNTYIKNIESIVMNTKPINQYIGFISYDSDFQYLVFKIKDIYMNRNIGSRCDQTDKKKYVSLLNDFIGEPYFNKNNVDSYTIKNIAILIEFTCRYYDTIKNNRWYVTTEEAYLLGYFQKKIIKK
uniref:Helicase ATP-binding domain-containing protein n=1 Tax=viral metagenome TaxID=1070528 RepID=A0A6C0H5R5_9ZZZZ